ncbi:hypothetical protein Pmani_020793 [Petrolisthes manimaculis]|uniref:Aminotransferase class I/classII large domain-containing protein n=1 Tax=Petrolisthes manimaculis TaxID=1843537 RepID=A0AAE1U664_9EUCA|nr:hypothetical protein Pmani_020793 [Petrolisthes manimaculis]
MISVQHFSRTEVTLVEKCHCHQLNLVMRQVVRGRQRGRKEREAYDHQCSHSVVVVMRIGGVRQPRIDYPVGSLTSAKSDSSLYKTDTMRDKTSYEGLVRPDITASGASANLIFNEKIKALIKEGREVYHFGFGQSPFPVPECLQEAVKEYIHTHAYLPMIGIPELREELVKFHGKYDDVSLDVDNFVVAPGSKELIYLIMATFSGDLLLPGPAWTTYIPQSRLAAKNTTIIHTKQTNGWKLTPQELTHTLEQQEKGKEEEKETPPPPPQQQQRHSNGGGVGDGGGGGGDGGAGTTSSPPWKLLILTNPGNPSGTCYTQQELEAISEVCRQRKVIVLSDEIYARLTFNRTHHSIAKYYPEGTILTSGFSKWASAGGWRIGYAHFPPTLQPLFQAVQNAASHTYSCAPAPMQYGVAKALRENAKELDEYMDNCSKILHSVSKYCYRELSSVGVRGPESEAGYYFMPDFEVVRSGLKAKGWTTGEQMSAAMLDQANIGLMSSHPFLRPVEDLSTRFCFVCFDGSKALRALEDLPKDTPITDDFLHQHCLSLVKGVRQLKEWVVKYSHN